MLQEERMGKKKSLKYSDDAVAIIGIGCKFPGGANNPEKLWNILENGIDTIEPIPKNRWDEKSFYNKTRTYKGKTVSRCGGFLDNIDEFDSQFFGITPREAANMDPQQRLLLETSWEAMEDAGLVIESYEGTNVGVFVGAFTLDYKILQFGNSNYDNIGIHTATGSMMNMVANRISYQFDFRGPSMAIDTACSSSLVAIHTACQSIRAEESSMALAGGVLLNMAPQYTIAESQGGFLSEDGRCKTFDESANGYVRGEGVGILVLKSLSEAVKDNDHIYSVILGSAVNQDGHTSSITVPNSEAQKRVIAAACDKAEVNPKDIQYVELHGTGTSVGDPLEAEAIGAVMSIGREETEPCIVGSVKTNIGHTEAAAGVAGVIKASLCLKKKKIPGNLHLNNLNPKIDLKKYNIRVPKQLEDWPETEKTALAGVNGFGFGGTNSHIVLSEAPEYEPIQHIHGKESLILPITARSETALMELAQEYRKWIDACEDINMYDLGYSMSEKRDLHNFRMAIKADTKQKFLELLDAYIAGDSGLGFAAGKKKKGRKEKTFVYTGMGPQWWKMGRDLMQTEEVFRNALVKCDKEFGKYVSWSLIEALSADEDKSEMSQTRVAQPANFAIQIALSELWKSQGIEPDLIIGHSAGEVAAFYMAGVISFEDAVKVIYYRSDLQQRMTGKGKMLAVSMGAEEIKQILRNYKNLDIVAVNSNNGVTLAGEELELDKLVKEMNHRDIFNKYLNVNVPFHSHYMEDIKDEFLEGISDITFHKPKVKLISSVSGREVDGVLDISYWWKNLRQSVLFADSVSTALQEGYECFLEIGPHPALLHYIKEIAAENNVDVVLLSSLNRKLPEQENFYNSYLHLFTDGYINRLSVHYPHRGNYMKLPAYAWQREKYWVDTEDNRRTGKFDHIILGHKTSATEPTWEVELNEEIMSFIPNHKIQGNQLFPAAGYLVMAIQAANKYYGEGYFELANMEFIKATFINPNKAVKLQIVLNKENPGFKIYNCADSELAARGTYRQTQNRGRQKAINFNDFNNGSENNIAGFEQDEIYERLEQMGFGYYHQFRALNKIQLFKDGIQAEIELTDEMLNEIDLYAIHPGILDACFQSVITSGFLDEEKDIRLPVGINQFALYGNLEKNMRIHSIIRENTEKCSISDISLYGIQGNCIAEIKGFVVQVLEGTNKKPDRSVIDKWLYKFDWAKWDKREERLNDREGIWLIFADDGGKGELCRNFLMEKEQHCILIKQGSEFFIKADGTQINVKKYDEDDIKSAFSFILQKEKIKGILHFSNLDLALNEDINTEHIKSVADQTAYSLIHIINSLNSMEEDVETRIHIVTNGAHSIGRRQEGQILQRPAWGVARLIRNQENTGLWGSVTDLDPFDIDTSLRMFTEDLLLNDYEDQIAYRDGERYIGRLNNIPDLSEPFPVSMDKDGYYMITGAFGALGKLVVDWIIERGAKKLILVGRNTVPERKKWENPELDSRTVERIKYIQNLKRHGVEVITVSLDMSNEGQINNYFEHNPDIKKNIKGIISTAGMVNDVLMTKMPREVFDQVYNTKAIGNWILHKQFENQELEFFVMFSSITAVVTATGQINYISGNSFIDGLAEYRRNKGLPALSIAWGPWAEGMIKDLKLEEIYKQKGMTPITASAGIAVLERIIAQNIDYALVIEADWEKVIDSVPRSKNPYLDHLKTGTEEDTLSNDETLELFLEEYKKSEENEQINILQQKIKKLVCKVLHLKPDDVHSDNSLSELGMDSMMSTELKNRIELNLGVKIAIVDLLNNQSIAHLAELVKGHLHTLLEMDTIEELVEEISEEELEKMLQEIGDMTEDELNKNLDIA